MHEANGVAAQPRQSWWLILLAASFPSAVAVQTALNLYVGNASVLMEGPRGLVPVVGIAFVLWMVLFAALTWGRAAGKVLWALPTAYAVFFLVRELAFPLEHVELVEGMSYVPRTSHAYRAAEVLTFLTALTLLTWVRVRVTVPLAAVFAAVFGVSALTTAIGNAATLSGRDSRPAASTVQAAHPGSDKPDVYQILFDEYQTVEHRFARKLKGVAPFDDFTCCTDNVSNYNWTRLSLPSLWTGSVYTPDQDIADWQISARSTRGILKTLKDHGYRIKIYGWNTTLCETPLADSMRFNKDIIKDGLERSPGSGALVRCEEFLQVLRLRCMPTVVGRRGYLPRQDATLVPPGGAHAFYCMAKFREMVSSIKETPAGGTYTFLHLILPHPPYVLDGEGRYVGPEKGSRFGQVQCIDKLVGELTAELKRLGRYDRSMIVVHADTGAYVDPVMERQELVDGKEMRTVSGGRDRNGDYVGDGRRWPVSVLRARHQAALLFKAPGQRGHREMDAPTQSLDIYPTILGGVGIDNREATAGGGVNLLAGPPAPDRVRRIYVYGSGTHPRYNVLAQEYLVRGGRYERGREVILKGRLDYNWENGGE